MLRLALRRWLRELADGTGWLFESKRGVIYLRALPLEYGLLVSAVLALHESSIPVSISPRGAGVG